MFEAGAVTQTVVDMQQGLLIVMSISDGSSLAVLAAETVTWGWWRTRWRCWSSGLAER